jgi:chemotaxis response regulator CheB
VCLISDAAFIHFVTDCERQSKLSGPSTMYAKPLIRVAIVDANPIVRLGLNEVITESGDMEVAGEAATSAQALRLLRETRCDVMLLGILLPDRNGLETVTMIRTEFPRVRMLMVSDLPQKEYEVSALNAGASGYLEKQRGARARACDTHGAWWAQLREGAGSFPSLFATYLTNRP